MVKSLIYDTFNETLSYNYLLHMLFFLSIWLKNDLFKSIKSNMLTSIR